MNGLSITKLDPNEIWLKFINGQSKDHNLELQSFSMIYITYIHIDYLQTPFPFIFLLIQIDS